MVCRSGSGRHAAANAVGEECGKFGPGRGARGSTERGERVGSLGELLGGWSSGSYKR